MLKLIEWVIRIFVRITIGTIILVCLFMCSLILWNKYFIDLFAEIERNILNEK